MRRPWLGRRGGEGRDSGPDVLLGGSRLLRLKVLGRFGHVHGQGHLGLGIKERVAHPAQDGVDLRRREHLQVGELATNVVPDRVEPL